MYNDITHNNINKDENYADEVAMWSNKFNDLMEHYWNAAAAIVTYYISDDGGIDTCPLGDTEFERLGKALRSNPVAFTAAEETGLIVEGVGGIFTSAIDNCSNWSCKRHLIKYILNDDKLSKHVGFYRKYLTKVLLSGGQLVCDDNDLWRQFFNYAIEKLSDREVEDF